ncbi:MAG: hypothetical protein ACOY82_03900 [Pseudomonadota bacterium]
MSAETRLMTWNYRVVRGDAGLRIHDVYYDESGNPTARHETPTYVYGDTVEELRSQMMSMLEALDAPVVDECEFKIHPAPLPSPER